MPSCIWSGDAFFSDVALVDKTINRAHIAQNWWIVVIIFYYNMSYNLLYVVYWDTRWAWGTNLSKLDRAAIQTPELKKRGNGLCIGSFSRGLVFSQKNALVVCQLDADLGKFLDVKRIMKKWCPLFFFQHNIKAWDVIQDASNVRVNNCHSTLLACRTAATLIVLSLASLSDVKLPCQEPPSSEFPAIKTN